MKKIVTLLVAIAVITGGVVLWQRFSFGGLSAKLQQQTDTIAAEYTKLVESDVLGVARAHKLTAAQVRLVERMKSSVSAFSGSLSLQDKIQQISMLQAALVNFTQSTDSTLTSDPQFQHIAEEISERSSIRETLRSYNDTAARWNARIQSGLGSLTGQLDSVKRTILPYLRFDGQQDFVPVITM